MIRNVLGIVVLLLLPTIVYLAYTLLTKPDRPPRAAIDEAPLLWLGLAGIVLAFAGIYLIWGTTYLAIAIAIQTLPPFLSGAIRFLIGGVLVFAWIRFRNPQPFGSLPLRQAIICGVLMSGVGNGFVVWAQQGVPSGIAALVIAATPVAVMVLDWVAFAKQTPRARALVGTIGTRSASGSVRGAPGAGTTPTSTPESVTAARLTSGTSTTAKTDPSRRTASLRAFSRISWRPGGSVSRWKKS